METKARCEWEDMTVDEVCEYIDAIHYNMDEDRGYIQVCDMEGRILEWSSDFSNVVVDHIDIERIHELLCYTIYVKVDDYSKVEIDTEFDD